MRNPSDPSRDIGSLLGWDGPYFPALVREFRAACDAYDVSVALLERIARNIGELEYTGAELNPRTDHGRVGLVLLQFRPRASLLAVASMGRPARHQTVVPCGEVGVFVPQRQGGLSRDEVAVFCRNGDFDEDVADLVLAYLSSAIDQ